MAKKPGRVSKPKRPDVVARPVRNVVPDRLDLRDRPYLPPVGVIPGPVLELAKDLPVLNQGDTNACTGFALASVVYQLQRTARRKESEWRVSPFMLYSMARRYDEFPGDSKADTGSSLRGAMKGWYKNGVCSNRLWTSEKMPAGPVKRTADDWWLEAVRRPLGAYYRIDTRSVTDMHVALNEVGILYGSAICHKGWDEGSTPKPRAGRGTWQIPRTKPVPNDGGHAFAIVGYDRDGFIIQNSWGRGWGTRGRAVLAYEDWLENAMDCWVAQLGVVTDLRLEISQSKSLRSIRGQVQLASDASLRTHEINPFIIDMENNGRLSNTGDYRTQDSDIEALVTQHLGDARAKWGLGAKDPVDIAIYAHGGLVSEDAAGETAAKWISALYNHRIFPIFLMWETDLWSTLKDRLEDLLAGQPRRTGRFMDDLRGWWNERLEKLLAAPGTAIWGEMKQNADAISSSAESGGLKLYEACSRSPSFADSSKVRLHLIGHSAGAILHSHIVDRLGAKGWKFESVSFMAPAVRVDTFMSSVVPAIRNGRVRRYNQFHLSDDMEQKDPTCTPILGYGRSLLYLVSRSFEKGEVTPILGLEKDFKAKIIPLKLAGVGASAAPGSASRSTTHGSFDDDPVTMESVISSILGKNS